jgi:hypothetical protein
MQAKSKKKSKNRAEKEKIAPALSRFTRAKDKKNSEDVALALARSQLDQIKLNEAKELDQNILDLAMRRSLLSVPETPRAYITVGGRHSCLLCCLCCTQSGIGCLSAPSSKSSSPSQAN